MYLTNKAVVVPWVLIANLLAAGCASHMQQYVSVGEAVRRPLDSTGVTLGIIEFDDQGVMFDTRQLDAVLAEIHALAAESDRQLRLVVYVHGWKHDASPYSRNLKDFPGFLEKFRSSDPNVTVFGLYMSWRGEALQREEPFNRPFQPWITFFSRIRAAGRVARPSFTEALLSVLTAAELEFNQGIVESGAPDRTTSVVIGHSMGGFVVEEAMSKALLGSLFAQLPAVEFSKRAAEKRISEARKFDLLAQGHLRKTRDSEERLRALEGASSTCEVQIRDRGMPSTKEGRRIQTQAQTWASELERIDVAQIQSIKVGPSPSPCAALAASEVGTLAMRARLQAIVGRSLEWQQVGDKGLQAGNPLKTSPLASLRDLSLKEIQRIEDRESRLPNPDKRVKSALLQLGLALDTASNALVAAEIRLINRQIGMEQAEFQALKAESENLLGQADEKRRLAMEGTLTWQPPADLVLLLNPASRGIYARHMISALKHVRRTFYRADDPGGRPWMLDSQRPWLISVSSEKDFATRVAFPIGATFDSLGERFRDDCELRSEVLRLAPAEDLTGEGECVTRDEQPRDPAPPSKSRRSGERSLVRRTATHNPSLWSHTLMGVKDLEYSDSSACEERIFELNFQGKPQLGDNELTTCQTRYHLEGIDWAAGNADGPHGRWNDSGYWVIHADESLIIDHNDIFSDRTSALVAGLIRMSGAFSSRAEPARAVLQTN